MRSPFFFLFAASFLAACSAPTADDAAASSSDLTEEQSGIDVQVLQVWTPGKLFPAKPQPWQSAGRDDVALDSAACATLRSDTNGSWEHTSLDCDRAFAAAVPFDVTGEAGPVMTPVRFEASKRIPDGATYIDPDFCNRIEVRAVVRDASASAPSFAGIGFWTARGETFTPKAELQPVGHVTLASGEAATVYRFAGISTCISSAHNSTSGNMYQTFSFKPYAAYDANGNRYRVWERIPGNHRIGRSWPGERPAVDATGFDRQAELLAR